MSGPVVCAWAKAQIAVVEAPGGTHIMPATFMEKRIARFTRLIFKPLHA
jgi:hypothetical protein